MLQVGASDDCYTEFVCLSLRPSAWYNSAPTRRIFTKFDVLLFLEILSRITGTWHEDLRTFMIMSRSFFPRIRIVSDQSCRENQNTRFIFNNCFFFRKSCHLWDKVEKYGTDGRAADNNTAHVHCMLDTQGYKQTLRIDYTLITNLMHWL